MHRCHLDLVYLGCFSSQDPQFQGMNLMETIAVLQGRAEIIEDRAKLMCALNLEAAKTYRLTFKLWKSVTF